VPTQPLRDARLERDAPVAQLRQLDEVLQLEVVDLVDQRPTAACEARRGA
jgi:hypothetical protein